MLMASVVRVVGGGYAVVHPLSGLRDIGSRISNVAGCGAHMLQCTETVTP